jgi:hypothetical protein
MFLGALTAALALGCAPLVWAAEMRSGEDVNVTGVFSEMLFVAGDDVKLGVTSTDDVFSAGGNVTADGATFDHVYMAGGDLAFQNSTARDVIVAGGDIDVLSGQITDDFVAAGGRITLAREARIGGDAVVAGSEIEVKTPIGGQLRAAGERIELNSDVVGDVNLDGGSITIGPEAHIHGSLTHRGHNVDISPQAQIDGQVNALPPREKPDFQPLREFAHAASITLLFGLLLMAVVVALAFPRLMNGASDMLQEHPLRMLAFGLLLAVFAPVLIILLMVTVLGLPLGFLFAALMGALWPLGLVASAYALGMFVRERAHPGDMAPGPGARALWVGGAMALLIAIGFVPVVGTLSWCLAYFVGIGAVAVHTVGRFSRPAAPIAAA